ncbi:MAG: DUF454 domain-containing protein [Epulopiscium sp.]|nr:DUF454 domain-containing protein [Candidatus Epulonipiscium sp.]
MKRILNFILILLGSISLVLGIIGIFMPILPTTPFLLLSAFCYIRSSKRLYHWLINHKVFGQYIYNYLTYGAVKKNTKIVAILSLWITIPIAIFLIPNQYVKIIIFIIATSVTIYILNLKTLTEENLTHPPQNHEY